MRFKIYLAISVCFIFIALLIFCAPKEETLAEENSDVDVKQIWEFRECQLILSDSMYTKLRTLSAEESQGYREEIEECVNKTLNRNVELNKFFKEGDIASIVNELKRTVIITPDGQAIIGEEAHKNFWTEAYDKAKEVAGKDGTVDLHLDVHFFKFRDDIDYKKRFMNDDIFKDVTINFSGDVRFEYKIIVKQAEKKVQNDGGQGWGECCHQTGCDCPFCGPGQL